MRAILAAVIMFQALITGGSDIILTAFKDCLDPSQKAACGREFSVKTSAFLGQCLLQTTHPMDTNVKIVSITSPRTPAQQLEWFSAPGSRTPVPASLEPAPGLVNLGAHIARKDALPKISADLEFLTWQERKPTIMV
uniref:Sodefrin-like factor 26 n=1 Tax=Lissotriton helveticus TaxID=256425 RepID=A0A0B5H1G3_9SALA|nr:sodefrin precursor-like factor 26 [Lissotriton helveticus]